MGNILRFIIMFSLILTYLIKGDNGLDSRTNNFGSYSQSTSSGDAYYVDSSWADIISFNGISTIAAYQRGYNTSIGSPIRGLALLSFGRQIYDNTYGWGAYLFQEVGDFHSNAWVAMVAQRFIDGYIANPTHRNAYIAIGVNNANYGWTCDNSSLSSLDLRWEQAGNSWGNLVHTLRSLYTERAYPVSANDFEAWQFTDPITGELDPWIACGNGALSWLDGYELAAIDEYNQVIMNINFGSHAPTERPQQWTNAQIYEISYGRPEGYSLPQIYCEGQIQSWVNQVSEYPMSFLGITSTNGVGTCGEDDDSPAMFFSLEAWLAFNTALSNAGFGNTLDEYIASFF